MAWFPNFSDYSPQKVNNVSKQNKTEQQKQKLADEEEDHADAHIEQEPASKDKKNDGLLDVYV
ncbi:hypothetical protein [Enterovibrio sp. 27052020O]|uniref:hypothetical protein n=1 Tax=Enterovibrio sp. 27052020O TaxID=3241166 RepID=UPI00388CF352